MSGGASGAEAVRFYSGHPISAAHIRETLRRERGHLENVRPEELYPLDQDHYDGLKANDALAKLAGMTDGTKVADFCAGLGGPARYWARQFGAFVTGIELTPARVAGAADLTRLVGLEAQVRVIEGNVMAPPLGDGGMDAVVSQEALLHVPDKSRAIAEAHRILRPGGRLVFTDWVLHRPLGESDAAILWEGMAAQTLQTVASYRTILEKTGFRSVEAEDLTGRWGPILDARFAMYRKLREETARAGHPSGHDAFYRSYERLVALVQEKAMGGARFFGLKS